MHNNPFLTVQLVLNGRYSISIVDLKIELY